jgi:hypothetical protein
MMQKYWQSVERAKNGKGVKSLVLKPSRPFKGVPVDLTTCCRSEVSTTLHPFCMDCGIDLGSEVER